MYLKGVLITTFNCVFNFNFLAQVVSEIIGGPKFTLGGPGPQTPPSGNFFFDTPQVLAYTYIAVKFQLRSSINVRLRDRDVKRGQMIEVEAEAETKHLRPRSKPRPS